MLDSVKLINDSLGTVSTNPSVTNANDQRTARSHPIPILLAVPIAAVTRFERMPSFGIASKQSKVERLCLSTIRVCYELSRRSRN